MEKINISLTEIKYYQLRHLLEENFDDSDYEKWLFIEDGTENVKGILKEVLYAAGEINK